MSGTGNRTTADLSAFYGPNAGYVLDLYDRYRADPEAVDPESRAFFAEVGDLDGWAPPSANGHAAAAMTPTTAAVKPDPAGAAFDVADVVAAAGLTRSIREFGHLAVRLDPLGSEPIGAPELDPGWHGISDERLRALPSSAVPSQAAEGAATAAEAIERLRGIYSGGIGYDFDHVQIADERAWLTDAVECGRFSIGLDAETKRAVLKRLTEVEGFERFLHQTYLGQKRFSIEGTDALVPMLDEIVHGAAASGTREVVVGMAHRGRLNVLAHLLGKRYGAILAAFEGARGRTETAASDNSSSDDGVTGDVKYHLGARLAQGADGNTVEIPIVLAPNPSHLEFVDPVVEGMARASQDRRDEPGVPGYDPKASLALLLHGDAAFPGQGIVAETLNLSGLPGYTVGGTIHVIVNNQIGFTTDTGDARSTIFAGDLAKGFEIPVVHVNADDPEACLTAARMAVAYRDRYGKDFLIDLVGYRRWGHNEGDEPAFTQPQMYATITKHPTVRQKWAEQLVAEGVIPAEEGPRLLQAALDRLAAVRRSVTDGTEEARIEEEPDGRHGEREEVETAVSLDTLREYHATIHALGEGFSPSPKLARQWDRRRAILDRPDGKVDWAHAESLAFAAILSDGIPIRLTGQDAERGTFSQRHLILHDATTGARHVPLRALASARASFAVYNSPLSEAATVGFEYGYSVHAPGTLVLWEAQFGDFANGAQVVIDQFIAAARAKWRQEPSLVLLLPHGYEGQGPEHSSARLERFLQLAAGDNMRVANVTTAAQYFHLLRRQAARLTTDARPLVLMTPKSLLRHPLAASSIGDLASGTFQPVLNDPMRADAPERVSRLVLCSGKVAVDLEGSDERATAEQVAVVRLEQLAPFQNSALRALLDRYPNLTEVLWVQEEPCNMGAWSFVEPRLRDLLEQIERPLSVRYAGRPERASPAEGSAERHAAEQARIVGEAFAGATRSGAKKAGAVSNGAARGANGAADRANGVAAAGKRRESEAPRSKR